MNRRDALRGALLLLAVADSLAQAVRPRVPAPAVAAVDPDMAAWDELTRRLAEDAEGGTWPKD